MENEKIFILVPVYKAEAYLERCIDSILNQTYTNWELVLVDDGSPDGSGAICDRYAAQYENITVIHQENGGVSAARNVAIENALNRGDLGKDWLNFIDSDDFVHPKYLEYLHRAAKEAGTEISCCGFVRTPSSEIYTDGCSYFEFQQLSAESYWCRNLVNPAVVWGKLYRLRCFQGILFPAGKIYEDNFTTYKVIFGQEQVAFIQNKLYNWYINHGSITMAVWTPAYMDSLESIEEQIIFFKNNGYEEALKKVTTDYYKGALNNVFCIRELSPKYDHLLEEAKAKRDQAFRVCLKTAGPGAALYAWFVPTVMSHKKLRKLAKKCYAWLRYRKK